jgi:ankyrin repeat protein
VLPNSVPGFGHGTARPRGPAGTRLAVPDSRRLTPLLYAARDGRLDSARTLVAQAPTSSADANGITPLLMAISNNHMDVARFLVEREANINGDWALRPDPCGRG